MNAKAEATKRAATKIRETLEGIHDEAGAEVLARIWWGLLAGVGHHDALGGAEWRRFVDEAGGLEAWAQETADEAISAARVLEVHPRNVLEG